MDSIETGNAGPVEPDKPRTPSRRKTKSKETVVGADAPHWTTQPPPPPSVALAAPPGTAKPMTAPKPKRLENPKAKANKAANEQLVVASLAAAVQGEILSPEVAQNERDAALMRQVGGTTSIMRTRPASDLTRVEAARLSTGDIGAIRAIQDQQTRSMALVAAEESRKAQPLYKTEFDRQAPALAVEAETAARRAGPRSSESERAHWLNKRVKGAALDGMSNTIEQAPARTVAPSTGAVAGVAHDATARVKEIVAGPAPQLKSAGRLAGETPVYKLYLKQQGVQPDLTGFAPRLVAEPPLVAAVDRSTAIPESVAKRFLKVDNDYFFPSEKRPAFIDRGTKLATRGENQMVINSLVEIAKMRGWDHITVDGTGQFRREAWLAASLVGIQVDGYTPTELDKADLARWPSGNSIAKAEERIKVEPSTLTLVKPAAPQLTKEQMADLRTKAASFANDKPSFVVKKYPDLAPAYGTLSAAALFAAEKLPGNEDRFAKVAREALVDMIARGETVPAPNLNQGVSKTPTQQRGRSQAKGDELRRSR